MLAIVDEVDRLFDRRSIQRQVYCPELHAIRILDNDLVSRRPESVFDRESFPALGNARFDVELLTALLESEYCLESRAIHPAR
jgi:hypothetical protein